MCDCLRLVNEHLEKSNARLKTATLMNVKNGRTRQTMLIATERLDSSVRHWTKSMAPAFCPFCGEEVKTTDEAEGG